MHLSTRRNIANRSTIGFGHSTPPGRRRARPACMVPGEPERRAEAERAVTGVPLPPAVVADLRNRSSERSAIRVIVRARAREELKSRPHWRWARIDEEAKEVTMHAFQGEFLGTMILILLGDGVVAGVLLNRTKSQNAGWIVVTAGWAFAVMSGVFTARAFGGKGFINPVGPIAGLILNTLTPAEAVAVDRRRVRSERSSVRCSSGCTTCRTGGDRRPGAEARRLLHRPGDPQLSRQPAERSHRHVYAWCSSGRRSSKRRSAADSSAPVRRGTGLGHRPEPGRHDRLRHQPGPRPGAADRACGVADSGQGRVGLGLCVDSGRRSGDRRGDRGAVAQRCWRLSDAIPFATMHPNVSHLRPLATPRRGRSSAAIRAATRRRPLPSPPGHSETVPASGGPARPRPCGPFRSAPRRITSAAVYGNAGCSGSPTPSHFGRQNRPMRRHARPPRQAGQLGGHVDAILRHRPVGRPLAAGDRDQARPVGVDRVLAGERCRACHAGRLRPAAECRRRCSSTSARVGFVVRYRPAVSRMKSIS